MPCCPLLPFQAQNNKNFVLHLKVSLKTFLDPIKFFDYLAEGEVPELGHLLPNLLSGSSLAFLRRELPSKWHSSLDLSAKIELSKQLLKGMKEENFGKKEEKVVEEEEDEEESEEDEEEEEEEDERKESTTKGWTDKKSKMSASLVNKQRFQLPQRGTLLINVEFMI